MVAVVDEAVQPAVWLLLSDLGDLMWAVA